MPESHECVLIHRGLWPLERAAVGLRDLRPCFPRPSWDSANCREVRRHKTERRDLSTERRRENKEESGNLLLTANRFRAGLFSDPHLAQPVCAHTHVLKCTSGSSAFKDFVMHAVNSNER